MARTFLHDAADGAQRLADELRRVNAGLAGTARGVDGVLEAGQPPGVRFPGTELPPIRPPGGEGLPPGVFGRDGRPTVEPRTPLNVFVDRATFDGPVSLDGAPGSAPSIGTPAVPTSPRPAVPGAAKPTVILDANGNVLRVIEDPDIRRVSASGGGGGGGFERTPQGDVIGTERAGSRSSGGGGHGTPGPSLADQIVDAWRRAPRTGPFTGGSPPSPPRPSGLSTAVGGVSQDATFIGGKIDQLSERLARRSQEEQTLLRGGI